MEHEHAMTNKTFQLSFGELKVNRQDLYDLAGHQSKGLEDFPDVVDAVFSDAGQRIRAKGGYHLYPLEACRKDALCINGQEFNTGSIIAKPFRKAACVAVFACTAGPEVKAACDAFFYRGESLMAYVMDILGTVVVEKAMDHITAELSKEAADTGWLTTNRYSPGYCGWHVQEQQKLWALLPSGFCGIHLNASSLMDPVKSISGLMGLGEQVKKTPYACPICTMEHCPYRNGRFSRK